MPFGLANAPACFQRFIQFFLREDLNISCHVYIDDILVFSKTCKEHQRHVAQVLNQLKEHKLYASLEKCLLYTLEVSFLEFTIFLQGIKMEENKLSTILDWPYPQNLKELGRFLGYLNFYRKFIRGFLDVAAPLTSLTQSSVDVPKGLKLAKPRELFEPLKNSFRTAPLLVHFDFAKPRTIYVDSSKYALSAVLSQEGEDGKVHPVSFLSKKWTKDKISWQVHDQELGAIVRAFKEWRTWLIDTNDPVMVMLDHAKFCYIMTSKHLSDRQTRWAAYLSSFYFVIKHVSGKQNPADPPNWRPDFKPKGKESKLYPQLFTAEERALHLSLHTLQYIPYGILSKTLRDIRDIL
jgi:hypothetical protein